MNYKHIALTLAYTFTASSALAADEVRLLEARSLACGGASSCVPFLDATIEVKNIAYVKQVGIHYRAADGSWQRHPAQYKAPTRTGFESWTLNMSSVPSSYAIYYTVNGVTYWDNNNGRNYAHSQTQYDAQLGPGVYLGDAEGAWNGTATSGLISGDILVRNMGAAKTVKAVYTDNAWTTTREGWASYKKTLPSGVELWTWQLATVPNVEPAKVQLAWYLNWGSGGAWDNNFGRNYGLTSHYLVAH